MPKDPKAPRTAAQKRATAKLVAFNKRLRKAAGGMKRERTMPSGSTGRKPPQGETYHLARAGGVALVGYGLLALPGSDGGKTYNQGGLSGAVGRFTNVVQNAKAVFMPGPNSNAYWAPTRQAIGTGLVIAGGAAVARKVPFLRRIGHRLTKKINLKLF